MDEVARYRGLCCGHETTDERRPSATKNERHTVPKEMGLFLIHFNLLAKYGEHLAYGDQNICEVTFR